MQNQRLRALVGFGWGLLLFLVVARCLRLGLGSIASESPVVSQVVLKTALVFVALIGWKLLGRPFSEMGWRRAEWWNRSHLVWFAIAAASMIAGSIAVILLETRHPIAAQTALFATRRSDLAPEQLLRGGLRPGLGAVVDGPW